MVKVYLTGHDAGKLLLLGIEVAHACTITDNYLNNNV